VLRTFAALFCCAALSAQSSPPLNTLTPLEKNAGWQLLFDGKSLNGWDDPQAKTPPGDAWTIEDGCIKAVKNPRIREDLLTTNAFRDFELVFDWRVSQGGNSGVKYRIQDSVILQDGKTKPNARFEETVDYEFAHRLARRDNLGPGDKIQGYQIGFEYQVIDDATHPDARRGGAQTAGALYSMIAPQRHTAKPPGEFNLARIVLRGNRVEHWLNGEKVLDTRLNVKLIEESLAKRWGRESPVYRLLMRQPKKECPIGLQNHNDEVWFRNIKVRRL
jgi:hypothetical protein